MYFIESFKQRSTRKRKRAVYTANKKRNYTYVEDGHQFYEVDEVLGEKRDAHGKKQYLIRWKGYSSESDSWEPAENLNEYLKNNLI